MFLSTKNLLFIVKDLVLELLSWLNFLNKWDHRGAWRKTADFSLENFAWKQVNVKVSRKRQLRVPRIVRHGEIKNLSTKWPH